MSKSVIATIADVEKALATFKTAAQKDPNLVASSGKKLAAAVEYLTVKDGVTKDLNQAYTNGQKWWSVRYGNDEAEGCTKANKLATIKNQVLKSDAYARHFGNPATNEKVVQWMAEKFPEENVGEEAKAA